MKKAATFIAGIVAFGFGVGVSSARADILKFIHKGSGSGMIGGNQFPVSDFIITGIGDTDDLVIPPTGSGVWFIDHRSASIWIDGLGSFDFITGTRTFVFNPSRIVGFSRASITGKDLFNGPVEPQFFHWRMLDPIGPISGTGRLLQWTIGNAPVHTTGGLLNFDTANTEATFAAVPVLGAGLVDIKPGGCPNPLNRMSRGKLAVALLGMAEFDVTSIDPATLELSRADGVGGSVGPLDESPGPGPEIMDVATPFERDTCDCHNLQGDGIDDLSLKFNVDELVSALQLDEMIVGGVVELVVTGQLADGSSFVGKDCVKLVPPVDVDADGDVDAVDFARFAVCFNKAGRPPRKPGCSPWQAAAFDSDGDGDVDGVDFGVFASCFNGAGNPSRTLGCP